MTTTRLTGHSAESLDKKSVVPDSLANMLAGRNDARPSFRQWSGLPLKHARQLRDIQNVLRHEWASAKTIQSFTPSHVAQGGTRWADSKVPALQARSNPAPEKRSLERRALESLLFTPSIKPVNEPTFNTAVSAIHEGLDELFPKRYPQYAAPDKSFQGRQHQTTASPKEAQKPVSTFSSRPVTPSRITADFVEKPVVVERPPTLDPLLEFSPTIVKTNQAPPATFEGRGLPSKASLQDSIFCPGLNQSRPSSKKQESRWASKPESLLGLSRLNEQTPDDDLKPWNKTPEHGVTQMRQDSPSKTMAYQHV